MEKVKILVQKLGIALTLIRFLIFYSGVASLLSLFRKNGGVILTYHSINDVSVNLIHTPNIVSTENFEKQIKYLSAKKKVVSLDELVTNIQKGIKIPKGSVVVTFDDGYKDNYLNAYPILKKYNIPATTFLATNYIDSNNMKWDDELSYKIKTSKCESLILKTANSMRYNLKGKKGKEKVINDLIKLLFESSNKKREEHLLELHNNLNVKLPEQAAKNTMLSWENVRTMAHESNISFGTHTCSHNKLTNISLEEAREEIAKSKQIIENEIGEKISFFSYPYGIKNCYNDQIKHLLRENGFICAVTANYGKNNSNNDIFELKRIRVKNEEPLWMFRYNLTGSEEILRKMLRR